MLSFDELRYFSTIADLGSIQKAAIRLFVTPGALSSRLKNLEHRLGFNVFLREKRSLILTDKGREVLSQFQNALKSFENLENYLEKGELPETPQILKWGAPISMMSLLIKNFWIPWTSQNPTCDSKVFSLSSSQVLQKLQVGDLDFGFAFNPQLSPDFQSVQVMNDRLVIVVRKGHPLLKLQSIARIRGLEKFEAVLPHTLPGVESCSSHPWFLKHGLKFKTAFTFDAYESAEVFVKQNECWSFIPEHRVASSGLEVLARTQTAESGARLFAIWRKNQAPNLKVLRALRSIKIN